MILPRTSTPVTPRSSSTTTLRSSSPCVIDTSRSLSPFGPLNPESSAIDEEVVVSKLQQSLASVKKETDTNIAVLIEPVSMRKPAYTVYSDADVQISTKNGKMSSDIRNRLVRGTIHNMVTAASSPPFNRFPTASEIEEMSKSLVVTYPCLKDGETGHVSTHISIGMA